MDRRNFLRSLVGGVAVTAAVRTWPFRVYSFPSEIIKPDFDPVLPDSIFVDTPIDWKKIAAAYNSLVLGYDDPDLIWVPDIETYKLLRGEL